MPWFSGKTVVSVRDAPSRSHSHREADRESRHSSHRDSHHDSHSHRSHSHGRSETKAYFVRPRSPARSSEPKAYFVRPHSPSAASSASRGFSLFGGKAHSSSSSSYRRRPRDGYVARLMAQLRRLWRDLLSFARRNPMKLVAMLVMPLLTGGALTKVLEGFGLRMPASLSGLAGLGGGRRSGSKGPSLGGFAFGDAMNLAKMFL